MSLLDKKGIQPNTRFREMGPKRVKHLCYLGALGVALVCGIAQQAATVGITEMSINPFRLLWYNVIGSMFTLKVIAWLLIIGLIYFGHNKVDDLFDEEVVDTERGIKQDKSNAAGTAWWMSEAEQKENFDIVPLESTYGTILGRKDSRHVIAIPEKTHLNRHMFIQGGSGSGKSRKFARPYAIQAIRRGESVLITDPKGEHYHDMAGMFSKAGYTVKVLNLVHPDYSDCWDCLENIHGDILSAQILAKCIIDNTTDPNHAGQTFWQDQEENLLDALILFVSYRREKLLESGESLDEGEYAEDAKGFTVGTLPYLYSILTSHNATELDELMQRDIEAVQGDTPHPAKMSFDTFHASTVKGDIQSGLAVRLKTLQIPEIQHMMDHHGIDLVEPARTRCAYFVIMSDQQSAMNFISAMFFAMTFIEMVNYCDLQPHGRGQLPVSFVLDEFPNIGQIPEFEKKISTVRSRGINICVIVQEVGQLQDLYPGKIWQAIVGNCDTQICLGVGQGDDESAKYWSNACGVATITDESMRYGRDTFSVYPTVTDYNKTIKSTKRNLMNPDEIATMPNDQCLIFRRAHRPLKAKKIDYTEFPDAHMIEEYPASAISNVNIPDPDSGVMMEGRDTINQRNRIIESKLEQIHNTPGAEIVRDPLAQFRSRGGASFFANNRMSKTPNASTNSFSQSSTRNYDGNSHQSNFSFDNSSQNHSSLAPKD